MKGTVSSSRRYPEGGPAICSAVTSPDTRRISTPAASILLAGAAECLVDDVDPGDAVSLASQARRPTPRCGADIERGSVWVAQVRALVPGNALLRQLPAYGQWWLIPPRDERRSHRQTCSSRRDRPARQPCHGRIVILSTFLADAFGARADWQRSGRAERLDERAGGVKVRATPSGQTRGECQNRAPEIDRSASARRAFPRLQPRRQEGKRFGEGGHCDLPFRAVQLRLETSKNAICCWQDVRVRYHRVKRAMGQPIAAATDMAGAARTRSRRHAAQSRAPERKAKTGGGFGGGRTKQPPRPTRAAAAGKRSRPDRRPKAATPSGKRSGRGEGWARLRIDTPADLGSSVGRGTHRGTHRASAYGHV